MEKEIQIANQDPTIFVITPSTNLEDLERDYQRYSSMPLDDMRMSDDKAISIYGMSNTDIYNRCKALAYYNETSKLDEGFEWDPTKNGFCSIDEEILNRIKNPDEALIKRIEDAMEENDATTVIIYPFTEKYPYTIEDLEEMFKKYNCLSFVLQSHSDEHCFGIFGHDNRYMYETQKNILLSLRDEQSRDGNMKLIESEVEAKKILISNADDLQIAEQELINLYSKDYGTVMECFEAEVISRDIDKRLMGDPLTTDTPGFTPSLTPTEIEEYLGDGELSSDVKAFLDEYRNSLSLGLANFDGEEYHKKIQELLTQKENQSHTIDIDTQLIELGWNPNVLLTKKGCDYARNRILRYINEYHKVSIIDATKLESIEEATFNNNDQELHPVFIVLSYTGTRMGKMINAVAKSTYSHACISFNSKLTPMYTYLRNGLSFETLDYYDKKFEGSIIKVLVTFVTREQYKRMQANLDYYISNREKTRYAQENLIRILFNKKVKDEYSLSQVCSQFVNQLLRLSHVNIFDKSNNLVSPDDFDKVKNPKIYVVYEGAVKTYNPTEVDAKINTLLMKELRLVTKKYTLKEAASLLSQNPSIEVLKQIECISSETSANLILEKIHDLITPESVLVEAKKIPFQINSKGIIIELPAKLEEQYQEIHKTLGVYEKTKSYEQMKPELARLWYINLIAERRIRTKMKHDKKDDAKKIRDTRARILNDFKKYLRIVIDNDEDFDFAAYFEASRYNDRKLFVDRETLAYSGKAIAKVLKSII